MQVAAPTSPSSEARASQTPTKASLKQWLAKIQHSVKAKAALKPAPTTSKSAKDAKLRLKSLFSMFKRA